MKELNKTSSRVEDGDRDRGDPLYLKFWVKVTALERI